MNLFLYCCHGQLVFAIEFTGYAMSVFRAQESVILGFSLESAARSARPVVSSWRKDQVTHVGWANGAFSRRSDATDLK